jgi:hypothetical protein
MRKSNLICKSHTNGIVRADPATTSSTFLKPRIVLLVAVKKDPYRIFRGGNHDHPPRKQLKTALQFRLVEGHFIFDITRADTYTSL